MKCREPWARSEETWVLLLSGPLCDPGEVISPWALVSTHADCEEQVGGQEEIVSVGPHTRDSQVQIPFPSCHMGYKGNRTRRLILQLVTPEKKELGIEGVRGRLAQSQPIN